MDYTKTAENFSKRFGRDCENVCFVGMPLTIIKGNGRCISAALSVGGFVAAAQREDGRLILEFDENTNYVSCNISELEYHKNVPLFKTLLKAERGGTGICGAELLFSYNTKMFSENETALISSVGAFCRYVPSVSALAGCLKNGERDMASIIGRKDNMVSRTGEKIKYLPFSSDDARIILCNIGDRENVMSRCDDRYVKNAESALLSSDYDEFGKWITRAALQNIEKGDVGTASQGLMRLAVKQDNAYGYGFLEKGGIFAIVKNGRENMFVRSIASEYEQFYGTSPEFYISETENSGLYGIAD